ncbi:hypothetical protein MTR67_014721 [Solanum verrucosum]|uniref:Uncharacterized protein n=1 Tax=Solanum verrucosum TaxID=315347 RepID=A0AAF0TJ68_SOLVR|nr:hypothetical protein MTR67_014721 [Solanum verrucosum]
MRRVVGELTWLVRLFSDLTIPIELHVPLLSNSQAAIHIIKNPVFHKCTKHVELDYHFVRQQFQAGLISLSFVRSSSQLADIFTKPLTGPLHHTLLCKLGVLSSPSNLRRGIGTNIDNGEYYENHPSPTVKTIQGGKIIWKNYLNTQHFFTYSQYFPTLLLKYKNPLFSPNST